MVVDIGMIRGGKVLRRMDVLLAAPTSAFGARRVKMGCAAQTFSADCSESWTVDVAGNEASRSLFIAL